LTLVQLADAVGEEGADTSDEDYDLFSPIYNFVIDDLSQAGDSVAIVMPLKTGEVLPENATFRKYSIENGWYNFVEDGDNTLSSAMTDSNGHCPAANDSSYTQGLTPGDNCFQLIIEDGGPNDADLEVNGSVEDPGAIVIEKSAEPIVTEPVTPPDNIAPTVVIAEHLQNNTEGSIIILTAHGSDIDNDAEDLTYQWQQVSGPEVNFDDLSAAKVYITLPEVSGDEVVTVQVTISDGKLSADSETTFFIIDNPNNMTVSLGDKSAGTIAWLLLIAALIVIRRYFTFYYQRGNYKNKLT